MSEIKIFHLGDFALESGATLPGAFLAYKTFGDAPGAGRPAVVYPTWFSGAIADNEWLVGDDMALSPRRYFVVIPALFGNGESTSPSNSGAGDGKGIEGGRAAPFPDVTFADNVRAQHRLLTEGLGLSRVRAVLGWSMGMCLCFLCSALLMSTCLVHSLCVARFFFVGLLTYLPGLILCNSISI